MSWFCISVILFCACVFDTVNAGRYDRNYPHDKLKPNPRVQGKTAELQSSYGLSDFAGLLNKFGKPTHHEIDQCEDVFQYPINLPIDSTIAKYGRLDLKGFQYTYNGDISYEGGAIIVTLTHDKDILISEGGLHGTFYLHRIRIRAPSANTVAGIHYPVAIQYIFINKLYESYEIASTHPDGLAVLIVFVTVGSETNPAFDTLVANILQLGNGDNTLDDPFSPGSLLPGELCSFFRYRGKFSTDACEEIATFTIFTDTIQISGIQLQELHEFLEDQSTSTTTEIMTTMEATTDMATTTQSSGGHGSGTISKRRRNKPIQHKRPRILDFSAYKPRRGPIVTIQPIMFCTSPLLDKSGFPWYLFHKH